MSYNYQNAYLKRASFLLGEAEEDDTEVEEVEPTKGLLDEPTDEDEETEEVEQCECPDCGGTGETEDGDECETCGGTGYVDCEEEETDAEAEADAEDAEEEEVYEIDMSNPVCPCCGARLNIVPASDTEEYVDMETEEPAEEETDEVEDDVGGVDIPSADKVAEEIADEEEEDK